jgi:hypothetical protein
VALFEDIIVLNHKEQNTNTSRGGGYFIKLLLARSRAAFSFFSWPIGRSGWPEIVSAYGDNVVDCFRRIIVNGEDDITTVINITAWPGRYGWSDPIIFKMVTEYSGTNHFAGHSRGLRWKAILGDNRQLKATKNGTDIRAEEAYPVVPGLSISRA